MIDKRNRRLLNIGIHNTISYFLGCKSGISYITALEFKERLQGGLNKNLQCSNVVIIRDVALRDMKIKIIFEDYFCMVMKRHEEKYSIKWYKR